MTPDQDREENRYSQNREVSLFSRLMKFWIEKKLLIGIVLPGAIRLGLSVAPFDRDISWLPRHPVPVDAIPHIGAN